MYEAAAVASGGSTTVSRFAATAARLGYAGLVVRNDHHMMVDYDPEALGRAADIDVVPAIEFAASDRAEASGHLGTLRPQTTVLVFDGGSPDLNRFGAEQPKIDVLADPMAGSGDVNHVIVKAAVENDVALELSLGTVLRETGGARIRALRDLRKLRELIGAYDAPYVVSAGARTHLHLRAPRELIAVGREIGFEPAAIEQGLAAWGDIAERNRDRLSTEFVSPGVWRESAESDGER